ncbi:3-oxoacyl-[acyl-carrier-protein] synthase III C-terminal domain-containing protein [Streptomyces mirabilis]
MAAYQEAEKAWQAQQVARLADQLMAEGTIVVPTFHRTGNMGAATLPRRLSLAAEQRRLRPGDTVALFGLAGGVSAGVMLINWSAPPPASALRR